MTDNKFFRRWLEGIPYEVAFWRSYYGSAKRRSDLLGWSQYGKPCQTDCFDIQQYIHTLDHAPTVLDLGCALSYAMGNVFGSRTDVKMEYVDPLASFYNRILEAHHIDRPRITFGMIEGIAGFYPVDSVDLIHVRNALDHCANPMQGILQSIICLRPGGVLYLNHFKNEAVNEGYRGFHQWNIDLADRRLVIWNEDMRIDVAERLADCATVETHVSDQGRIVAIIRKIKGPDVTSVMQVSAGRAISMMMESVEYFHGFGNSMKYQWLRLWSTMGHRTMRLLPYSLVKRIKKALK